MRWTVSAVSFLNRAANRNLPGSLLRRPSRSAAVQFIRWSSSARVRSVGGLGQGLQEFLPIHIVVVNVLSPVSAAHHVMNRPRIIHAQWTRHKQPYARPQRKSKATIRLYVACPLLL
jgi:hypothetical protein